MSETPERRGLPWYLKAFLLAPSAWALLGGALIGLAANLAVAAAQSPGNAGLALPFAWSSAAFLVGGTACAVISVLLEGHRSEARGREDLCELVEGSTRPLILLTLIGLAGVAAGLALVGAS